MPHGLIGKAYVVPIFVFAAIVVTIISTFIVAMPFWIVASIFVAIIVALISFTIWASMQPTSGEG